MLASGRASFGVVAILAVVGCGNGTQHSPAEVDASRAPSSTAARTGLHAFTQTAPNDSLGRATALGARGLLVRSANDAGRFEQRAERSTMFFSKSGLTFAVASGEKAWALRATMTGASAIAPAAEEQQAGRVVTREGEQPAFARVAWNELYPGIDMVAGPASSGGTEYQFVLSPGAKVASIAMRWEGATRVEQVEGGVDVVTEIGALKIRGLHAFAIDRDRAQSEIEHRELPARHVVRGDTVGFEVDGWDGRTELVIDPVVTWSSFAGGTGVDSARAIALDASGNVYVGGQTAAADFPHTIGTYSANNDIFIMKLTPAGAITWSAIYGGSGNEDVADLTVDSAGNVYFVGTTNSTNFPVSGGFDTTANGSGDALVGKLNSAGAIAWAGYLGGGAADVGHGIALDASANVFVTGNTASTTGFPLASAFRPTFGGGGVDAFVTKITSAGAIVWSSYLGGSNSENNGVHDGDLAVDGSGGIFVGGTTQSPDFPVTSGAYSTSLPNSNPHGFLVKVTDGTPPTVAWSTFVNGMGADNVYGVASSGGAVFLTGRTSSTNFPVTNGSTKKGTYDAFVTAFLGTGALAWSTYYGGTGDDYGYGISVGNNAVFVTGTTASTDLATTGAFQATNGGGTDAFVARLSAGVLQWSSYLGRSGTDQGLAIAADGSNNAFVAGDTTSSTFSLSGAFDSTYSGQEGFVIRVRPAALGAACTTSADCGGPCVDGVCCNTACAGTCQACTAAKKGSGVNGTCGPIASGADPDAECAAASCTAMPGSATRTPKQTCNGAGACTTTAGTSCGLYLCNGTACATNCVADANCVNTAYCASPSCLAKKVNGAVCSANNQCTSGFCVDGVCCNSACTAKCQACTNAKTGGTTGTCANVKSGTDPDGECAAATCVAGIATPKENCNGAGTCTISTPISCGTFPCSGTVCGATCTTDAGCTPGAYCAGSVCAAKKANGATCTATNQCTSGFCADGVCCDSVCSGSCQACTAAKKGSGTDGTCAAINTGTDPDSECAAASCTAGSATPKETCDGIGSCTASMATACAPYACAGTSCATSCTIAADCVAPNVCTAGACVPPVEPDAGADTGTVDTGVADTAVPPVDTGAPGEKPVVNGGYGACKTPSDCASGFCVDGVCCDRACDGTCESCAMPFSPGKCVPVPIGLDPKMQCSAIPCTRTCNGAGACINAFTGAQCALARCTGPSTGAGPAMCSAEGSACPTDKSIPFDCGAYACAQAIGACFQMCTSSEQCAPGNVCDLGSKSCVAGSAPTDDGGGCSVHNAGSAGTNVIGALVALAALGTMRRRRASRRT